MGRKKKIDTLSNEPGFQMGDETESVPGSDILNNEPGINLDISQPPEISGVPGSEEKINESNDIPEIEIKKPERKKKDKDKERTVELMLSSVLKSYNVIIKNDKYKLEEDEVNLLTEIWIPVVLDKFDEIVNSDLKFYIAIGITGAVVVNKFLAKKEVINESKSSGNS